MRSIGLFLSGAAAPTHTICWGISSSSGPTLDNGSARSCVFSTRILKNFFQQPATAVSPRCPSAQPVSYPASWRHEASLLRPPPLQVRARPRASRASAQAQPALGTGPKADFSKAARSRPCAGSAPNCSYGPEGDCGRHCFSETGSAGTWEAAALPCEENGGCSFWRMDIPFADGRKRTFWRRERPHLAMEAGGTIAALTTGTMDARVYMYDDNAHRRATQRVPMGTDIATSVRIRTHMPIFRILF